MYRISDFHVNEIDFNGRVCKLTDLSLPKSEERKLFELKSARFIPRKGVNIRKKI